MRGGEEDISLLHSFHTISVAHPALYSQEIGALSQAINRLGREPDNKSPSSVEIKSRGAILPLIYTRKSPWIGSPSVGTNLHQCYRYSI